MYQLQQKIRARYTASPSIADFHKSDSFVRGLMGPLGSGKSVGCCMEIYARIYRQKPDSDGVRRSRWVIIRNTYPQLMSTTYKTWEDCVERYKLGGVWKVQQKTHFFKTKTVDAEVIFLALEHQRDIKKLLSLEVTGAWINEAREINEDIVANLIPRIGRYPRGKDSGWYGLIMDTNPPSEEHWWYKAFEVNQPEGWEVFKQPSGISDKAENIANLPEGYYTTQMSHFIPSELKVYRDGEYGYTKDSTSVYPDFNETIHVIDDIEYLDDIANVKTEVRGDFRLAKAKVTGLVYVGIDFGNTPAATIGMIDKEDRWTILDEICTYNMSIIEFGTMLNSYLNKKFPSIEPRVPKYGKNFYDIYIYGDPAGEIRQQTDMQTLFQVLSSVGIRATAVKSNSPWLRRQPIKRLLTQLQGGKPLIRICKRCVNLIKGFQGGFCYKESDLTDGFYSGEPRVVKNKFSHVMEALEYMLLGGGEIDKLQGYGKDDYFKPQSQSLLRDKDLGKWRR